MTMSLYVAAFLAAALGVAHSILGEHYILVRLFRRSLPRLFGSDRFTAHTLRFAWHVTTVAWFGFAALLLQLGGGQPSRSSVLQAIGWTFMASALLPLVITRGRHLAWLVLAIIGAIALYGSVA